MDVADEKQVAAAVRQAAEMNSGRIDVLCNNASYLAPWHDVVRRRVMNGRSASRRH